RLAEIQKLIKLEIPQELVPGFDPETEFFEAGSRSRSRRPLSPPAEEAPRAPRSSTGRSQGPAGTRTPRQKSSVAADGFDFSKPYEPVAVSSAAPSAELQPTLVAQGKPDPLRRPQRPIAVLLGGLGRK
ncbi:MAG: hypothetical protein AB7D30_11795, partial [Lysobacteraceae bacterium]